MLADIYPELKQKLERSIERSRKKRYAFFYLFFTTISSNFTLVHTSWWLNFSYIRDAFDGLTVELHRHPFRAPVQRAKPVPVFDVSSEDNDDGVQLLEDSRVADVSRRSEDASFHSAKSSVEKGLRVSISIFTSKR